jgi:O-antigen ligase
MSAPRRIDLAAFLVTGAGTALVASDQGGFFARSWPWAGLYFAAVGALALLSSVDLRVNVAALALMSATAALCAWTALSWFWSSEPSTSLHEALRTPIYLAAAVTFVTLAAAGGSRGLLGGVAAGTTAVAAYSLADRYLHGVHQAHEQARMLEVPLGYANALGVLCGIGLVVVAALGVTSRKLTMAALSAASAAILVTALALTDSRGAWLAVAAGTLVAAAAGAGGRRWAVRAALLVALLASGLFAITAFSAPGPLQARGEYWHAAWQVAARHPVGGTGAGTFDLAWAAYGDLARWGGAVDAHNLYLETLSELGLVGLVLIAALMVPVAAAVRTRRPSATTTAALAGAVTFLVHAGLDWDWEMPAVTVAGIACLAATLDFRRPSPADGPRIRITLLVVEVATILGYVLYLIVRV